YRHTAHAPTATPRDLQAPRPRQAPRTQKTCAQVAIPSNSLRSSNKSSIVSLNSLTLATAPAPSFLLSKNTTSALSKNRPSKLYPIPSASLSTSANTNYPRVRFLMSRRSAYRVRFLNGLTGGVYPDLWFEMP